jgi:very-short-patch-repair endonuclease
MPAREDISIVTLNRARKLRRNLTNAEVELWTRLRRHQLGVAVRRQHPIGPYVLDFFVPSATLAIEIDGPSHLETDQIEHDEARTQYLSGRGIRVIRFSNDDVELKPLRVIARIREEIQRTDTPL